MIARPLLDFISQNPEQTLRAGEHLGAVCRGGEVIGLSGALGSGKTILAQGIARGLGVKEVVTSPTFTILKEYRGRLALNHFDFYRLEDQERDAESEFAEYRQPGAVCVVEWPEHADTFLPAACLRITLRFVSAGKRSVAMAPHGEVYEDLLRRFQALAFRV
jgi:tRNA threonylcarbamoyladenosine biosynthesis protein TsaE